ncbi:MAG: M28 family peptidase [Candidatus Thorarchaeota archaeon]
MVHPKANFLPLANFGTQPESITSPILHISPTPLPVSSPPPEIQAILNQITTNSYSNELTTVAVSIGPRLYGTDGNDEAVDYIASVFNDAGLEVSFQHLGSEGPNVIGKLPGGNAYNNQCIVVGAHFDSYPGSSNGADDNGSGIAAVLEMAKAMSQNFYNYTILFVGFNAEESGLVGSSAFASKLENENVSVALMYNFDMLLWESPNAPLDRKIEIIHNGGTSEIVAQKAAILGQTWIGAPVQTSYRPGWWMSDHSPFWDRGIPAIWFFECDGLNNPYIHSDQDYLGRSDYSISLGTAATQTAAASLADFATIVSENKGFPQISFVSPLQDSFPIPHDSVPVILAIDDDFQDVIKVELSIDDGPWIDVTTGLNTTHCTYFLNATNMYGPISLKVRVFDAAGWVATSRSTTTFDRGVQCIIHSPNSGELLLEGVQNTIWINVSDIDGYPISLVHLRINAGSWIRVYSHLGNHAFYYNWTVIGQGLVSIEARAIDVNGNLEIASILVTVESFPPVISDVYFLPLQPYNTDEVMILVNVTQDSRGSGINTVLAHFDIDDSYWRLRRLEQVGEDYYSVMLGPYPSGTQIRFFIEVQDNLNHIVIDDNDGLFYSFATITNPSSLWNYSWASPCRDYSQPFCIFPTSWANQFDYDKSRITKNIMEILGYKKLLSIRFVSAIHPLVKSPVSWIVVLNKESQRERRYAQRFTIIAFPVALLLSMIPLAIGFFSPHLALVYLISAYIVVFLTIFGICIILLGFYNPVARRLVLVVAITSIIGALAHYWLLIETQFLGLPVSYPNISAYIAALANLVMLGGFVFVAIEQRKRSWKQVAGYVLIILLFLICLLTTYQMNLIFNPPILPAIGTGLRILIGFCTAIFAWTFYFNQNPPKDIIGPLSRMLLVLASLILTIGYTVFALQYAMGPQVVTTFYYAGSVSDSLTLFAIFTFLIAVLSIFTEIMEKMATIRPLSINYEIVTRVVLILSVTITLTLITTIAITLTSRALMIYLLPEFWIIALQAIGMGLFLSFLVIVSIGSCITYYLARILYKPLKNLQIETTAVTEPGIVSYTEPSGLMFSELQNVSDSYAKLIEELGRVRAELRRYTIVDRRTETPTRSQLGKLDYYLAILNNTITNRIQSIQSLTELGEGTINQDEQQQVFKMIRSEIAEIEYLVKSVQILRMIDADALPALSRIDLCTIIPALINELKRPDSEKQSEIKLTLPEEPCLVIANDFIQHAFRHLLQLALDQDVGSTTTIEVKFSKISEYGMDYWLTEILHPKWVLPDIEKVLMFRADTDQPQKANPSLLLVPALIEHFRGKFRIKNIVPDDPRYGTAFHIILPRSTRTRIPQQKKESESS